MKKVLLFIFSLFIGINYVHAVSYQAFPETLENGNWTWTRQLEDDYGRERVYNCKQRIQAVGIGVQVMGSVDEYEGGRVTNESVAKAYCNNLKYDGFLERIGGMTTEPTYTFNGNGEKVLYSYTCTADRWYVYNKRSCTITVKKDGEVVNVIDGKTIAAQQSAAEYFNDSFETDSNSSNNGGDSSNSVLNETYDQTGVTYYEEDSNPQTGSTMIYIVWGVGILTIAYMFFYTKNYKPTPDTFGDNKK